MKVHCTMKKAIHMCLAEEPEIKTGLTRTRTKSASFYFTGYLPLSSMQFKFQLHACNKQINKIDNNNL